MLRREVDYINERMFGEGCTAIPEFPTPQMPFIKEGECVEFVGAGIFSTPNPECRLHFTVCKLVNRCVYRKVTVNLIARSEDCEVWFDKPEFNDVLKYMSGAQFKCVVNDKGVKTLVRI